MTVHAQVPPPLPAAVPLATSTIDLSQSVTVEVQDINELSISANVTLTIDTATAGSAPDPVQDASATYSLTTNGISKKITGSLDSNYPAGITLSALLGTPTGGAATQQALGTTAVDLVTGFGKVAEADLSITYTAQATISTPPNLTGETRVVTLTLMDN